jgi:GT2 family glycosyltransferase
MGANFAVPRDTLKQMGGFAEDMPSYGGDERYVEKRVRAVGGHLVYVGGATVHHQISANKLSPSWFRRRLLTEGKAVAHLKILKASRRSMLTIKAFASGLKAMILGLLAAMRHKLNPSPSNFSHSCRFWFGKGLLGELLGHFLRGGR